MQNSMAMFTIFVFDQKHPFQANLVQNVKMCQFKAKFGSQYDLNMQNSIMLFTLFVFIQLQMSSIGKFDPKCQNCQFKVKLDTQTNSNMLNSIMLFTFSVFDQRRSSWANLVQIVNIFNYFCFRSENSLFWENLVQNVKIVSLRLNLLA